MVKKAYLIEGFSDTGVVLPNMSDVYDDDEELHESDDDL